MKRLLAIYRAERFSPNSVGKDKAIMDAVCDLLKAKGNTLYYIKEEDFIVKAPTLLAEVKPDVVLTMGRDTLTLTTLAQLEGENVVVINRPCGVRVCARTNIDRLMREANVPVAPLIGDKGYWIKRGDEAAQSKNDVVFARNEAEKGLTIEAFHRRGVTQTVVTAHVEGDLVKFYGVLGTGFFSTYYPCDDGISKFGDERLNGKSHHYGFSISGLQRDAERTATLANVVVYGGDCIIRSDGSYAIIDFNDWPSFSRCREEAAEAIASVARKATDKGQR